MGEGFGLNLFRSERSPSCHYRAEALGQQKAGWTSVCRRFPASNHERRPFWRLVHLDLRFHVGSVAINRPAKRAIHDIPQVDATAFAINSAGYGPALKSLQIAVKPPS